MDLTSIVLNWTLAFLVAPGIVFLAFVFFGRALGRPIWITSRESVVTILTPIKLCRKDELKKLLLGVSKKSKDLFAPLGTVHFARWAILPGEPLPGGGLPISRTSYSSTRSSRGTARRS